MDSISQFLTNLLNVSNGATMTMMQALTAVVIAYFGGILSSLTPCIYPMIPITVSVVGGMGPAQRNWRQVAWKSLAYVAGMCVVYSFLGVLAGLTGKIFGTFTNTPGWYLSLGAIMTVASLMMMDVLPFDPAVWWDNFRRRIGYPPKHKPHAHGTETTAAGAFALGASSGFIAAPCTTPVLTSILAYIAKTQSIGLGMSLMFAFSLGLGTLLIVIAIFTGALQILPRSGNWMKRVKLGSGLLLLIFAQYLIYRAGKLGGI